jgi:hypothetical protein
MKIPRFLKQLFCKHRWLPKNGGTRITPYFISNERRCPKCKKTEYKYETL